MPRRQAGSGTESRYREGVTDGQQSSSTLEAVGTPLVAILHNPPTTPGDRTRGRVEMARRLLGFDSVRTVNLCSAPTYRSSGLTIAAAAPGPWEDARTSIAEALSRDVTVLLAYGVSEPAGAARHHYRTQVAWLEQQLRFNRATSWTVGDGPRHPSRWQRYTHREMPNVSFVDALERALSSRTWA